MAARTLLCTRKAVLDGPASAVLDRRLLAAALNDPDRDYLRLYRLTPTVSLGRHQALAREVRLDYCRDRHIPIVRRPSGGGALYLDRGQLAFSLVTRGAAWRGARLDELLHRLSALVARALRATGVAACAAPPNDVEVTKRKIASVYASREAGVLLATGVILVDLDVRRMLEALRVPTEKLTESGFVTARARFASVAEMHGGRPAVAELERALIAAFEHALDARARAGVVPALRPPVSGAEREAQHAFAAALAWDKADAGAIECTTKTDGGVTLRGRAVFGAGDRTVERFELATDAQLEPADFPAALTRTLRGVPLARLPQAVQSCANDVRGLAAADILALLQELAAKARLRATHGFSTREVNALMLHEPRSASRSLSDVLAAANVLLVPYCAKPAWCKWRHRDGCSECGLCEVGEAYRLGRERGMAVVTITNYEHLVDTLRALKARVVPAYLGMCCGHFFLKRRRAFADADIPAVLMDVGGSNCYELKQEEQAYAGTFRAQSRIDLALLERVFALRDGAKDAGKPCAA